MLATLLAPISWGTTYLTVTELLPAGRPLLVASARVLPAGIVLLLIGRARSNWRPRGRQWGQTFALSLCYYALFFPLLIVGVYRLPGGVAATVSGVQPLIVALVGLILVGIIPRRIDLIVGVVAAIGVAMVVLQPAAGLDTLGVVAAIAATSAFAVGIVLNKKFPTPSNRLADAGWQMLLAGAILVPLTLMFEGLPSSLTSVHLLAFAYLSLVVTAMAYLLWMNGVRKLPAAAPPLLNIAVPVTAALMGWIVLGQTFLPLQLLGLVLSLGAIAYGAVIGSRRA